MAVIFRAGIVVEEKQDIVPKEIARRLPHQQLGICTEKRHARREHVSTEKIFLFPIFFWFVTAFN